MPCCMKEKKQDEKEEQEERSMTLSECYGLAGGDYEEVVERIGNEILVERFLLKFLQDPSYVQLTAAIEENDVQSAFRAVHTLKGVCLNLGLTDLFKVSSDLTEKLRGLDMHGYEPYYEKVQKEYKRVSDTLQQYIAQKSGKQV